MMGSTLPAGTVADCQNMLSVSAADVSCTFAESSKSSSIAIEQLEVSLDTLKADNYTVPVFIKITTPGVTTIEFGVSSDLDFSVYDFDWEEQKLEALQSKFSANGCESRFTALTSRTLPEGMTDIGWGTFYVCQSLASVTIPESVTYISNGAFGGTPWLQKKRSEIPVVIVNNILIDGADCKGDVVIPENVVRISDLPFWGNDKLHSLTILNPDCLIPDRDGTLGNKDVYIVGYENSTAQKYAEAQGNPFLPIGSEIPTEPATEETGEMPVTARRDPPHCNPHKDEYYVLGDATNDTTLDIMDVIAMNKFLLGAKELGPAVKNACDVNGDGVVDSCDSLLILKRVLGIIDKFPIATTA